jgi:vanillate/3-O-methylgallate O-demethylase
VDATDADPRATSERWGMSVSPFADLRGLPYYDEPTLHLNLGGRLWGWEFDGWKPESMSWKTGCYIHTGLSNTMTVFRGPDLKEFFSSIAVNSFETFEIGSMKHSIYCNDDGLICAHAILQRNDEQEYRYFAGQPWPHYKLVTSQGFDVQMEPVPFYLTQVAGPSSLETLERATGESLRDIGFLRFREAKINGTTVEVGRIGMSGNLAYELRGPLEDGPDIYDAVVKAGKDLGIQRLGWRTYLVNYVEGGFPQMNWTFASASDLDPGYVSFVRASGFDPPMNVSGSVDPADRRARLRTPVELRWERAVRFDHDFTGRAALEAEVANPRRRVVTLRWNAEDVIDIYASLLQPGAEYKTIDLPTSPPWSEGMNVHADHLLKDGRPVGVSSGTIYSYFYREVLSHGSIDADQAEVGNEVVVQWGDHGGRIKDVRATVERFPYLTEGRNNEVDTFGVPLTSNRSSSRLGGSATSTAS